jgi:hypothetical protein
LKKEQNETQIREKQEKNIVVMASQRRAMTELGRVTFPPDTTSGGGSPRVFLKNVPIEMDCEGICYHEEKASS